LYDTEFVAQYVTGLDELEQFVKPYTPQWAAEETGIPVKAIQLLAQQVSEARPKVIFHGGWMLSRYIDSFYSSRTLHILNVLMGNIEAKGGILIAKGPKDAGAKGLRSLGASIPEVTDKIVDADMKDKSLGTGHVVNLYKAIKTGEPYPVKALFAYRYDPMASLPDPEAQKKVLDNLDLLVSIDVNYSETSWYSDVILPEATYLERSNIIATKKGPKPSFIMRRQAIAPLYDSKPAWEIFAQLARRMGAGQYFPYNSIEEIWNYQLEGTNVTIDDFTAKGQVALCKDPLLMPRDALKFPTPSGKIELLSSKMAGKFAFLAPYVSPRKPGPGEFRLTFGRSGAQSHAQSQNNLYLNEITPENSLWINEAEAAKLGIAQGDRIEVSTEGYSGTIKANVTPFIHPEAVFMLHGYGSEIPLKTRSFQKGLRDTKFQTGLLETVDPVGGGVAYMECMVKVNKA
jgi:thiosulfate reductase/polysulfide reductase chain A